MVYFDNSATSYPKPKSVITAVGVALKKFGGNPGRSGHKLSFQAAEKIYETREKVANFFSCEAENVVFTLNCTHALNIAIKGLYKEGTTVISTELEHNSVLRPLYNLSNNNHIKWEIVKTHNKTDDEIINNFKKKINNNVSLIVSTHASNVTGQILPISKIHALAKEYNIPFVVDAAQSAGIIPLKLEQDADIICCAGHKGLYGPTGIGLLILSKNNLPRTLIEGGTGNKSLNLEPPSLPPERYEAGTLNTISILGLNSGIDFINKKGIDNIHLYEQKLCNIAKKYLMDNKNITIYEPTTVHIPIILFNFKSISPSLGAQLLSDQGFALRGGLHCSPLAHKALNTLNEGAIRFSPSIFNTKEEVYKFINTVNKISVNK